MPFEFGDVVLVPFPFTDQTAAKQRPAVVVSPRAYNLARPDLIMMAITSQLRATPALGEVWLRQWQAAGLLKPSAVKPILATFEQCRENGVRVNYRPLPQRQAELLLGRRQMTLTPFLHHAFDGPS